MLITEGIDLVQQVRSSTRKRNTLDLFFTQEKFPVFITYPTDVCLSDQLPDIATLDLVSLPHYKRIKDHDAKTSMYSFCSANYELLNQLMYDSPFSPYCWSDDNMLVKQWYEWIDTLLAKCIPRRTTHRSSLAPWISPTTANLIKRLETAYQQKGTLHSTTLRLKKNAMLQ